eukprot:CAMPEP_0177758688 /NCGR_PEP_ID=MMETSP0491_2-20121128/4323_1 /TAXON_ID=63592 /ORGANISM="Tetraselmis chuii, Strain PLY429" /LENGTH=214 /DNA_ID=CAMNT_0019274449 /DNA_START=946 /DNA_END=1590 /DNA_ORIENTATION=-
MADTHSRTPSSPSGNGGADTGFQRAFQSLSSMQESSMLVMLLLASAVEFFASLSFCKPNYCGSRAAWALSAGIVSVVGSGLLLGLMHGAPDVYHKVVPYMAGFLFVWWIPGAGVTTFSGPFLSVGNGYFGAWGAFLSAFLLCHARLAGTNWRTYLEKTMKHKAHGQPSGEQPGTSPYPAPSSYPPPEAPQFPGQYPPSNTPPPEQQPAPGAYAV